MNTTDALGYVASSAVLMTFLMTRMTPLRVVAIVSNLLFIAFGFAQHIYPVLILHLILLPVNLWRLVNAGEVGAARLAPVYSRRYATWFAVGIVAAFVSASSVMAFGVPEYDHLARSRHVAFSLSSFNPVTNAFRVIKSAKAHVLADEEKPAHDGASSSGHREPLSI